MYTKRVNLHKQIAESRKILREKFKKFKKGTFDMEDDVNKALKPIIQPLNKLAETSHSKPNKRLLRHSTPDLDDYSQLYTNIDNKKNTSSDIDIDDVDDDDDEDDDHNHHSDVEDDEEYEDANNDWGTKTPINESGGPSNTVVKDVTHGNESWRNNENIIKNENDITKNNVQLDEVLKSLNLSNKHNVIRFVNMVKKEDSRVDRVLGVRKLVKGFKLGDASFSYNDKFWIIKGEKYTIIPGLTELIFNKNPNDNLIDDVDESTYRRIIMNTNALRKGYKSDR